ncbi:SUMF1/EgtB/PvdO family nonheme iron enzyme, partial [Candidatus Latescibacterota bacterium]
WWDAIKFCNELSSEEGLDKCYNESTGECDFTKNGYRLPTEAEWEYACRAGTTTAYNTGDSESDLSSAGWYISNSSSKTHPAGQKTTNAWGLYDMHGNVWEWCNDWYSSDYNDSSPSTDPTGSTSGSLRVVRGGSWNNSPGDCQSAGRSGIDLTYKNFNFGFRVVRGAFTPGYTISGTVTGTDGVMVTLSGDISDSQLVATDGGSYSFTVEHSGSYLVIPSKDGYTFSPTSQTFNNMTSGQTQDFTATEDAPKEIVMVSIPAGSFEMGSNDGAENEKPVHTVTLDYSFEMSAYEITQGQYETVAGENPSYFSGSDNLPVEDVSRTDILKFCNSLSDKDGLERCYDEDSWDCDFTKNGYRLPTEAEWEYACRAGTTTKYYTGDSESDLAQAGWYEGNSEKKTHSVGQKEPNAWGLYDMYGNIREWCHDWSAVSAYQADYLNTSSHNPTGPPSGVQPVVRGGSYGSNTGECRSAYRGWYYRGGSVSNLGFRVVRGSFTPGYTVSGTITGADGVTIMLSGDATDSQEVNDGGSYSFSVVHGNNYVVTPSKDGYEFTPSGKTFTNLTANQMLNFNAIIIRYTLTIAVNQSGWGTTIAPVGDYKYEKGTEVTIVATPAEGYRFVNWTGDVADANSSSTTVTMTEDETVTANFASEEILTGKIAFSSERDGNWEIYIMDMYNSNKTRLTINYSIDRCPSWSPDGSKIAFYSERDGNYEIYVMNADGSNQHKLTNNPGIDTNPSWSPDGLKIAFSSYR